MIITLQVIHQLFGIILKKLSYLLVKLPKLISYLKKPKQLVIGNLWILKLFQESSNILYSDIQQGWPDQNAQGYDDAMKIPEEALKLSRDC
ncbi:20998_t:CDS:2 [Entrophospora sp. SA101]|nr:20998_t:CDS:2 [Entrophospora sp. SA101]